MNQNFETTMRSVDKVVCSANEMECVGFDLVYERQGPSSVIQYLLFLKPL